jgi:hypothetical protein
MKRLMPLVPRLALLGLGFGLLGLSPRPCSAFLWKHSTVTIATAPIVPLAPIAPVATTVVVPGYVTPMVAAPTYYTAAYSPVVAASPLVPAAAAPAAYQAPSLPVAPMSFLAGFNPDAPMVATTPGYHAALPQAKGTRILQGLRDAVVTNPSLVAGPLIQLAANLFGQEFGFSPNPQDVSVLTGLVAKVLDGLKGGNAAATSQATTGQTTTGQAAPSPGPQTLVITVTLPASSRVSIRQPGQGGQSTSGGPQGGSQGGSSSGGPGTNSTGASGGPGNP